MPDATEIILELESPGLMCVILEGLRERDGKFPIFIDFPDPGEYQGVVWKYLRSAHSLDLIHHLPTPKDITAPLTPLGEEVLDMLMVYLGVVERLSSA